MFLTRRCLFLFLVLLGIIILFSGMTVIDYTSTPKPVAKYSAQIMDIFNFRFFYSAAPVKSTSPVSVLEYSTKHINDIALNETTAVSNDDASRRMSLANVSESREMRNFKVLSSTRKPSTTSKISAMSNENQRVSTIKPSTTSKISATSNENQRVSTIKPSTTSNISATSNESQRVSTIKPSTTSKISATSNESQRVGDRSSNVHTEKTYTDTFLDVPEIHFTDILRKPPVDFLPNIKNPCWIEKVDSGTSFAIRDGALRGKLRCLPYFFVLGFPKCGTTDLYHRLSLHPDVMPPCAKEPHWWSRARFQGHKTLNGYLECFDRAAVAISESLNYTALTTRRLDRITMDCSASTAWDQSNWRLIPQNDGTSSSEPNVTNIHAIHHLLPDSKFIVIMRNPVNRTFSDYLFFKKPSIVSAEDFHQRVNNTITELETCFNNRSVRSCVYDKKLKLKRTCRLHVSLYSLYVEEWLALFPRKQFLFLKTEDYGASLTQSFTKIYKFLGLVVPDDASLQEIANRPNANTRSDKKKAVGEMLPETRRLLEKFYSPWNRRLAKLLNDDRYLWF